MSRYQLPDWPPKLGARFSIDSANEPAEVIMANESTVVLAADVRGLPGTYAIRNRAHWWGWCSAHNAVAIDPNT